MKKEKEVMPSLELADGYSPGTKLIKNVTGLINKRIMVGVALTGLIRAEWALARYSQVTPCNWGQIETIQWIDQYSPIGFVVADARNTIVHHCVTQGYDWLFQIDHDVVLPPHTLLTLNERMIEGECPMWSGLYFTKSRPAEPIVYRGRSSGYYDNWKFGDIVWCDGIPSGCTMIHSSILKVLYDESESYEVTKGLIVKRVYDTPAKMWFDPETSHVWGVTGTEDLEICRRIIEEDIFKKAGWPKYAKKKYPFMIDTGIFCRHIDHAGHQFPIGGEEIKYTPEEGRKKKRE